MWMNHLEIFSRPEAIENSRQYLLSKTDNLQKPAAGFPVVGWLVLVGNIRRVTFHNCDSSIAILPFINVLLLNLIENSELWFDKAVDEPDPRFENWLFWASRAVSCGIIVYRKKNTITVLKWKSVYNKTWNKTQNS